MAEAMATVYVSLSFEEAGNNGVLKGGVDVVKGGVDVLAVLELPLGVCVAPSELVRVLDTAERVVVTEAEAEARAAPRACGPRRKPRALLGVARGAVPCGVGDLLAMSARSW